MKLKEVKLSKLVLDPQNSVTHDKRNLKAITASLNKFGQYRAFVVQKSTNKVIIGNGMLVAMLDMGKTTGQAYIMDCDDSTAKLMGATDNKTGELSEWDMPNLKDILIEQDSLEVLEMGWENFELDALLGIDNGKTPDFSDTDDLSDIEYEHDTEKEKKKKNTGRLDFNKEEWAIVRDAIVKLKENMGDDSLIEPEAIAILCKRYLEDN